jgi:hypothetical protein
MMNSAINWIAIFSYFLKLLVGITQNFLADSTICFSQPNLFYLSPEIRNPVQSFYVGKNELLPS